MLNYRCLYYMLLINKFCVFCEHLHIISNNLKILLNKKFSLFLILPSLSLSHITIADGLDESSIVDNYYLCHTASKIIVEFGDEVPHTFYVLYVTKSLFSANTN